MTSTRPPDADEASGGTSLTRNTTVRLASMAASGEILVTTEAASAAGLDPWPRAPTARAEGKQVVTDVVRLRVDEQPGPKPG